MFADDTDLEGGIQRCRQSLTGGSCALSEMEQEVAVHTG